jgi:excisionase family DNA binding protein
VVGSFFASDNACPICQAEYQSRCVHAELIGTIGTQAERLAYSVDEAARLTGLSRDLLYDEVRRGKLTYVKVGRRRLIARHHLQQFLGDALRRQRRRQPERSAGPPPKVFWRSGSSRYLQQIAY